jgi:hypothetical protein
MIRSRFLITFFAFNVSVTGAFADGVDKSFLTCKEAPSLGGMELIECRAEDDVTYFRYGSSEPASPYATEFDRRSIVLLSGLDANKVIGIAGLSTDKRSRFGGKLIDPPMAGHIKSRDVLKLKRKFAGWMLYGERIQYLSQAGLGGFVIDCVTAKGLKGGQTLVVAECFPLEERDRYLKTLKELR